MTTTNTTSTPSPPPPEQTPPANAPRIVVCPYCGCVQPDGAACRACAGLVDPLTKQATQNAMGPWCVRDEHNPFKPGCSYETLRRLVERSKINAETIIRGPTTNQFWAFARDIQGVANLLGHCHNCHTEVRPDDYMCRDCAAILSPNTDRQSLGLAPVRLLPGHAPPQVVARAAANQGAAITQPTASPVAAPSARRVGAPANTNPATIPASAHTAQPSDQPTDSAITTAATTRRLRRQLASVRAMIALLIVANFILLAFLAALVIQLRSNSSTPDTTQQQAPTSTPTITEQPPTDNTPPAPNPAAENPTDTTADSPNPAPAPPPIDQAAANRAAAQMAQAIKLADLDTIKNIEQAIAILQSIARETPESALPPGLDEHLTRLNARLDELYLRQAM